MTNHASTCAAVATDMGPCTCGEIDGWERARMARFLGLDPRHHKTWPMDIIDRLIEIENTEGSIALKRELCKLVSK